MTPISAAMSFRDPQMTAAVSARGIPLETPATDASWTALERARHLFRRDLPPAVRQSVPGGNIRGLPGPLDPAASAPFFASPPAHGAPGESGGPFDLYRFGRGDKGYSVLS
jgi:hypothetical protein